MGGPTKGKRPRWVPLIGPALDALRVWVDEFLPQYCSHNPRGLVFPGRRGGYRSSWVAKRWHTFQKAENFYMRFHDLRHTAGSSLGNGIWGRKWALDEVRDFLGHKSVTQTEKYAHSSLTAIDAAAACTTGSVVHTALVAAQKIHQIDTQQWDPSDPYPSHGSPVARQHFAKNGTTNGLVCTTSGGLVPFSPAIDVIALLTSHPLAPAARALAALRSA
jgi:hypothetical protein